ncbi:MAG: hypothetical protein ABI615_02370 [Chthoniobacterales bacterium]
MNTNKILEIALLAAAAGQGCMTILNLYLVRIMGWKKDIARMPLLIRQVFQVHVWFISITLLIFSALTWRFAGEIASGAAPVYRWFACGVGCFWGIRAVLQVTYYKSSHWQGIPARTIVHVILLVVYSTWAAVYLTSGLKG